VFHIFVKYLLTYFQKNFTLGISRDCVMNLSLKISSHLERVDDFL